MAKEEEFLKSLLTIFRTEAEEHISAISSGLLELEKQPLPDRQKEIIEVIYRGGAQPEGRCALCQSLQY
jgi:two-component system chemotaxis sensor kinase CheA